MYARALVMITELNMMLRKFDFAVEFGQIVT